MAGKCAAAIAFCTGARSLEREDTTMIARKLRQLAAELVIFRRQSHRFNTRVFRDLDREEGNDSRPAYRLNTGSQTRRRSPAREGWQAAEAKPL